VSSSESESKHLERILPASGVEIANSSEAFSMSVKDIAAQGFAGSNE
jgi:hypothetical protein